MIKINLTNEQKIEIEKVMKQDIDKNIYPAIETICNYLKSEEFNKTAELMDTKEKTYKICLLENKSALIDFQKTFQEAFEDDSRGKTLDLKKETWEHIKKEFERIYRNFSCRNVAYYILKVMKVNVCPYCNRQYTFTLKNKTRPEFDHFFPKSDYPFLAVSMYNLVPSCGLCNKFKSNSHPKEILYPYEESFEDKGIHFVIPNVVDYILKQKDITIKLEPVENHKDLINQYNGRLKIELLYNQHSDYISELLCKNYIFNDDTIESIYSSYPKLFNSPSELRKLILGNYEPDNFNQRPLSKLTKDILKQLAQK